MMSNKGNKFVKDSDIVTSGKYHSLNDELDGDAAVSTGPADHTVSVPLALPQLTDHLKAATVNFEKIMDGAVKSMLDSIKEVQKTLEFESRRISELEKKNQELEKRLEKVEKANQILERRATSQDVEVNLADRIARKNNFRVVGMKEGKDGEEEDCAKAVEGILTSKFKLNIKVDSARRVGKRGDKPRHIVVKTSSLEEKIQIMKEARATLKKEDIYFIDDLTRIDLEEKKKYKSKVQDLYAKGTKLRFFAGHWRGSGGAKYFSQ